MQYDEQTFFGGTDSFITLKHLTIGGTNFQIGQKLAELALEIYGQVDMPLPVSVDHVRARRAYFQRSHPIHWQRMCGVATAAAINVVRAVNWLTGEEPEPTRVSSFQALAAV